VNRLRNRLILIFLAATLVPFGVTVWVAASLLERSLSLSSTRELDEVSKSLQQAGRELYQQARQDLRKQASGARPPAERYSESSRKQWPPAVVEFWSAGEPERFLLSGTGGDRLDLLLRRGQEVWRFSSELGGVSMDRLTEQYRAARELVETGQARDWRKGFTYTYVVLAAAVWLVSLGLLILWAHRVSRPIQQLTDGLSRLAAGDLTARLPPGGGDEIGQAMRGFNATALELEQSRDRLVYLTQLASWQSLARKMAHELKNSLTPIRLTMEEMLARRAFLEQGAQIVVEEVEGLERRVRAFSEFAAEPPVRPAAIEMNTLLEERIGFLKTAHPEVAYTLQRGANMPQAWVDEDLIRGVLTNLLENAAEAAGSSGRILAISYLLDGKVAVEVHDSGPGLSPQARQSLFQPTISFKKQGMGLGLSISRKSALLAGGDIVLVEGRLGGAGFRLVVPAVSDANQAHPDRR